ncbi:SIP domain-containing protein [Aeromicrobium sp. UC242_57]|uniref:SIP domain-containing protein n=1 Tax=Aeromicrobium sp. UC242_57 TaxID=3374624 RepID=UPI00378812B6
MRSHRRRQPTEHAFIAGDVADLPGIVTALAWLPPDAYGQVLIEVGTDEQLPVLAAPPRVTVHRLERSPQGRGIAVGRAAAAWVEEWIPDEPDERRSVSIWVGQGVDLSCSAIIGLAERL